MRNVVIVLGAGASCEYRAPLMREFYEVATALYVANSQNKKLQEQFDLVFSFMNKLQKSQAKANLDIHNIESVYTALEMAKLLDLVEMKETRRQSWRELDSAMKYFLTKCIESKINLPHSNKLPLYQQRDSGFNFIGIRKKPAIDDVVEKAVKLKKQGWNVTFVTFNYDLVIEAILATQEYHSRYCLPNDIEDIPDTFQDSLKVLKLHGSMNWNLVPGPRKAINSRPIYPAHSNWMRDDKYFQVSTSNKVTTNFSETTVPFIVPPVWNKSYYHSNISAIWKEAAVALSKASHIYSLGYSLPETDGFFKQLFALGTVGNLPLQSFGVFDIEEADRPNGVKSRFESILGRGSENVFTYSCEGAAALAIRLDSLV